MGEIYPRSDPDIAHIRYYLGPLKIILGQWRKLPCRMHLVGALQIQVDQSD